MSVSFCPNGPTFTLGAGFNTPPLSDTLIYTDISAYMRGPFFIDTGRTHELDSFNSGTANFTLDNRTRRFDPAYTAGTYYTYLIPMVPIIFQMTYAAVTYTLYTGFVSGWPQSYDLETKDAWVTIGCVDLFTLLTNIDLPGSLYEFAVATDKPDHWYKFHEASGTVAKDTGFSDNALYDGLYTASPTLGVAAIVPYDGGQTCVTWGDSQFLTIADPEGFQASGFSVEGWFTHGAATRSEALFELIGVGITQSMGVGITSTGTLTAVCGTGSVISSAARADDGLVHHWAFTRPGAGGGAQDILYLDGVAVANATAAGFIGPTLLSVSIGVGSSSGTGTIDLTSVFLGTQSHVAYWSALVLTPAQIANHYAAGKTALIETTGARAARVLTYAGVPAALQSCDTGNTTLGAVDLSSQSALAYLQVLADTEFGACYVRADGNVKFRQRWALITPASAYTTSQATFTDSAGTTLGYMDYRTDADVSDIYNEARVGRAGGAEQLSSDAGSNLYYGRRVFQKTDLPLPNDNEASAQAQYVVQHFKDPHTRLPALKLVPMNAPATLWPQALGRKLEEVVTTSRTPQGVGSAATNVVAIQAIHHEGNVGHEFYTTWELTAYDVDADWFILNTSMLNTGILGY